MSQNNISDGQKHKGSVWSLIYDKQYDQVLWVSMKIKLSTSAEP